MTLTHFWLWLVKKHESKSCEHLHNYMRVYAPAPRCVWLVTIVPVLMCPVVLLLQVLLAIGRDPTTKSLGLDKAGVETVG